ncbi:hypothetical protein G6F56_000953 [Rhizopus delemar]|nr:hypothetical protein G6F56_000953 [Rhizopus delemar]
MPSSRKKSKKHPSLEYRWVHNNEDQIDHLAFFNHFIHLDHRDIVIRFNNLIKNFISDETRKREVQEKYKAWKKSNEAKVYWSEREARQKQLLLQYQSESVASVIESVSGSNATSSFGASSDSTASVGMDSNEVMQLIKSNIVHIDNENTFKINDFIDSKTTSMMLKNTYEQIGLHSQKFSRDTFVQLFEIVQQCITDEEGNKLELTTRLVQPLLQPLFEDRAENLYLRWTDTQTEEFKKDEIDCSNKRPDGSIMLKTYEKINLGFIEVKEEKCQNNETKLNKDLYRLGVFSKNAIDQNHLLGVLGVQVVGASISFYFTKQQCKGFYTMTEIDHLNTPKNLTELPQLIGFKELEIMKKVTAATALCLYNEKSLSTSNNSLQQDVSSNVNMDSISEGQESNDNASKNHSQKRKQQNDEGEATTFTRYTRDHFTDEVLNKWHKIILDTLIINVEEEALNIAKPLDDLVYNLEEKKLRHAKLIQKLLPRNFLPTTTRGETELWSGMFDPILLALFSDPDRNTLLGW